MDNGEECFHLSCFLAVPTLLFFNFSPLLMMPLEHCGESADSGGMICYVTDEFVVCTCDASLVSQRPEEDQGRTHPPSTSCVQGHCTSGSTSQWRILKGGKFHIYLKKRDRKMGFGGFNQNTLLRLWPAGWVQLLYSSSPRASGAVGPWANKTLWSNL